MTKKAIIAFLLTALLIVFSSCSNVENAVENPLLIDPRNPGLYGTEVWNVTDWLQIIDFNDEPITLEVLINNTHDEAEYGVILFVDGIRLPFTTNEHSESDYMQVFRFQGEEESFVSVTFSPTFVAQGETVAVNIATILNPRFRLESMDFVNYLMHHRILPASPYHVRINTVSETEIPISNTVDDIEPTPQELQEQHANSDENVQFMLYQNSLEPLEHYFTVQRGEDLQLSLACFGDSGSYRVSLYINHEIVPAFNGKEYFDVDVELNLLKTRHINIPANVLELFDEFSHIYFIAVPLEQGDIVALAKSQTMILHIT
jgi:hypothetical protein